jgi:hypothetical protein
MRRVDVVCAGYGHEQGKFGGNREGERAMSGQESGAATGTRDKDYNLIWFVEASLSNALRMQTYIDDAERDGDGEVADLFRKAQSESPKGAEIGKKLLLDRLAQAAV